MAVVHTPLISSSFLLSILFFPILSLANADTSSGLQTYIIQLQPPPVNIATYVGPRDLESWYMSFLPNATTATTSGAGSTRIVHKYRSAITGFAAKLTEHELKEIANKEGFLNAYPDRQLQMFTTHTPTFLGLQLGNNGFWNDSRFGRGVIIGIMDTGAAPGHPSFHDDGMPPPPAKWKGKCAFGKYCNNKIIGGRTFDDDATPSTPPDDSDGHGTHTASIAAGNFVRDAAVLGNGKGTAAGMAPHAHLAIYRVCGAEGCMQSGLLAGMDAAIEDGVDVISLSLGDYTPDYDKDAVAIGAFAAAEKGIFVSCAAGNSGQSSMISNQAPWVLTVGASTMDRRIRSTVVLGDGREFDGESVFLHQPDSSTVKSTMRPLVYPAEFEHSPNTDGNCDPLVLKYEGVKDKVVVCERPPFRSRTDVEVGMVVKRAGGAGMILLNGEGAGDTTLAEAHVLPASNVNHVDGSKIASYVGSTEEPTASIVFKGTVVGNVSAPAVASFSSRGPSTLSPCILKPDIIGPGVGVVASWPARLIGTDDMSSSSSTFQFMSGTSVSAPHLSGIAALVKGVHPDWSPAAIKSAIMTTSDIVANDGRPIRDEERKPASLFMIGAGHVNPAKAADPGLVYDLNATDYVSYLCGLGRFTGRQVETITKRRVSCDSIEKISESQLNYPSITVAMVGEEATVSRTVTNVGEANEEFNAKVDMPKGVEVSVVPEKLSFGSVNEKKKFTVTFKWSSSTKGAEGHLSWVSEKHVVRSPIVIMQKEANIIN